MILLYIFILFTDLYADQPAFQVGDILTVIILESSLASQDNEMTVRDKDNVGVSPSISAAGDGPLDVIPQTTGSGSLSFNSGVEHEGRGRVYRRGKVQAIVGVKIIEEVSPGLFRIEGKKKVEVNKSAEEIVVKGLIRKQDIRSDNTVLSTSIADAEIKFIGKGDANSANRFGIITWILSLLF